VVSLKEFFNRKVMSGGAWARTIYLESIFIGIGLIIIGLIWTFFEGFKALPIVSVLLGITFLFRPMQSRFFIVILNTLIIPLIFGIIAYYSNGYLRLLYVLVGIVSFIVSIKLLSAYKSQSIIKNNFVHVL